MRQEKLRGDAERFERELADKGRLAQEAVARMAELDRRELDLTAREAELNRLQASIAHAERDANRGPRPRGVEHPARGAGARARRPRGRGARTSRRPESHKQRTDKREARLATIEQTSSEKLKELDEHEGELELREAQLEADVQIRGDKLEEREEELAELEERLANQEPSSPRTSPGADRDPAPRVRVVAEAARTAKQKSRPRRHSSARGGPRCRRRQGRWVHDGPARITFRPWNAS